MKRKGLWVVLSGLVLLTLLSLGLSRPARAAACQSQASGPWENASTWTNCNGGSPAVGDSALIQSGHTVTLGGGSTAWWVDSTTVESGGVLVLTRGIRNSAGFVISGTLQINSGGWVENLAPTYASGALLRYNSGGLYGRGLEWSAPSGAGYPYHVQIGNNTALDLGNGGTGTARALAGNLTIDSGSALYMDYGSNDMTASLTVGSDVTNNGTLSLSELAGGDLLVGGNWTNNGTFNCRGRQVTFNGSSTQTVGGSAATTFDYLLIDNVVAGEVVLSVDITVARQLQINDSSAELSAGSTTITLQGDSSNGPVWVNNGTFNRDTSTVLFRGENEKHARVLGSAVTTFHNVTLSRSGSGSSTFGVDFYDHDTGARAHIAGTLTLNQFTFIASEEDGSSSGCGPGNCDGTPIYDSGSTLRYNNSGSFGSAAEWWPDDADPVCGTDKGMPYNVVMANSTAVNINAAFGNNGQSPNYPAGSNKTACGSLTIESGSTLTSTAGTLSVKDNWTLAGTFAHNNGTVRFNGNGGGDGIQTVNDDTTFYDLTLDSQGGVTVSLGTTTITIVHDLSKTGSSGTMDPGTGQVSFIGTPSSILGAGKKVFYDLVIVGGATVNHTSGTGDIYVHHDMTNNGTFSEGASQRLHFDEEVDYSTTVHTLSGSGTTTFGNLQVWTDDTLNVGTHNLSIVGSEFWISAGSTFNGDSATVTFKNTTVGTDLRGAGTYNFNHVLIDSGAILLGVDTATNNKTFYVAGNWTNNGTYTHNNGKVVLNGSGAQTLGGSSATTFYDLTLNNSAGALLGQNQEVTHTLTLQSGRLTLGAYDLTLGALATAVGGTLNASNMVVADGSGWMCKEFASTGSFAFPVGDATGTANYSPATLDFTAGTFGPGRACLNLVDAKHPNNNSPNDYLTRYWTVTATDILDFSCNLTLTYVDGSPSEDVVGTEANILGLKYDSGVWTAGDPVDTAGDTFTMTVSSFSDFTGGSNPAAVRLAWFEATPHAHGALVRWETESERENLGFHLYRSTGRGVRGERLNEALIPSRAPGQGQGASYTFLDTTAQAGVTYYYTLEDVDASGLRTAHGPVVLTLWRVWLPAVVR